MDENEEPTAEKPASSMEDFLRRRSQMNIQLHQEHLPTGATAESEVPHEEEEYYDEEDSDATD